MRLDMDSRENTIIVEIAQSDQQMVRLREILVDPAVAAMRLPMAMGADNAGRPVAADLAELYHLLVAGTTGSGKSVWLHAAICSLLFERTPDELVLVLIDPKMGREFALYADIPHLLGHVITDPAEAAALTALCAEMDARYEAGDGEASAVVVVIDELADQQARVDVTGQLERLTAKGRAAGIHIIAATQRPASKVITGTAKACFPSRLSFALPSSLDSRMIIEQAGAERLTGKGAALFKPEWSSVCRLQAPMVELQERTAIAAHWRGQGATRPMLTAVAIEPPAPPRDELYDRAVAEVLAAKRASGNMLRRRLGIGYNRAADLIERMEREGIVEPGRGNRARKVLLR